MKKIILPDHIPGTRAGLDAVTPMTFIFLTTMEKSVREENSAIPTVYVTRTGTPVTLLNLSLYEPEMVFKCLNELFILLTKPALDHIFRDPDTRKLKSEFVFVFIVDNGPSEAPSNSMVQLCLVRL